MSDKKCLETLLLPPLVHSVVINSHRSNLAIKSSTFLGAIKYEAFYKTYMSSSLVNRLYGGGDYFIDVDG